MNLHPYPHLDTPLCKTESMFQGQTANPFRTHTTGCQYDIMGLVSLSIGKNTGNRSFFYDNVFDLLGRMYHDAF